MALTTKTHPRNADRYVYLYCDRASRSSKVACAEEESKSGDHQMGTSWHCSMETALFLDDAHAKNNIAHTTQRTIRFINGDAASIHGSLKVGSVYTSESGEWKLGGFEVLSSVKDDESVIYVGSWTVSSRVEESLC